jgi:hypothetical protein
MGWYSDSDSKDRIVILEDEGTLTGEDTLIDEGRRTRAVIDRVEVRDVLV